MILDHPGKLFLASVVVLIGLIALIGLLESREREEFLARCEALPKSRAECDLLWEIKATANAAAMSSAIAIGIAAGKQ